MNSDIMKYSKLPILVFLITLLGASGCTDDGPTNTGPTIEPPSAAEFDALQQSALDSRTETIQFTAEDGTSFTSQNGVDLNIPAGCLTSNGQSLSGQLTLEYVELFERSDMLVTNKPTMGLTPNGDKKALISGGSFFMNLIQNGNTIEASCNNMQLIVPGDLTGGVDTDMTLWKGATDEDDDLAWETADDTTGTDGGGNERLFIEGPQYFAFINDFTPVNVDRFYFDPRPKTTLQVQTPLGYDQANSDVYLSYDGEENTLAKLDRYDEETGIFSEHYGQIPVGLEMHVIFATEDDGQWRYAIKDVTVAEDDLYTFTNEETELATEQELIDAIKDLP